MLKQFAPYFMAKIRANKGDETINSVLLIVLGLALVALVAAVIIGNAKNSINSAGGQITNLTNTALNAAN